MDGGNFDTSIDGGSGSYTQIRIHDDTQIQTSFQYLYDSGNLIARSFTGRGYEFILETGKFSKFYKILPSVTSDRYNLNLNNESYKILPSGGYKIYSQTENIVYGLVDEATTTIYGRTSANEVTTTQVLSPESNQSWSTSGVTQSNNNYYSYYKFNPLIQNDIIPSEHLLYVYNLNSQESIDIKNYYFQMRTGITGANILGINCHMGLSGDITDTGNYINNIRTPIHRFIMTGNKPIKYACLLHGIPTRMTGLVNAAPLHNSMPNNSLKIMSVSIAFDLSNSLATYSGYSRSPQFTYPNAFYQKNAYRHGNGPQIDIPFLYEQFTGTTALFTHIGSLERRTADVSGYIRRICEGGKVSGVYLLGSGQNTSFLCYSNESGIDMYTNRSSLVTFDSRRLLSFYSDLGVNISFSKARVEKPEMTGYNVGGFTSDGWHRYLYTGGTGINSIASDGGLWESSPTYCHFSGYNWYLSTHRESLGGQSLTLEFSSAGEEMTPHSPFSRQTKAGAMGGTNYNNIPVGFVGSMEEPSPQGIQMMLMFDAWFYGRPFIEAAYIGMQDRPNLVMGDPLLKWR